MPFVPAKCPECGGNVVVDDSKEAWVCDFCKTPFIVEKAINNFNVVNNIVNNTEIKADVVNVYESREKDYEKLLTLADKLAASGKYDDSKHYYRIVLEGDPDN